MRPCPPACAQSQGCAWWAVRPQRGSTAATGLTHSPFCLQASVRKKKGKGRPVSVSPPHARLWPSASSRERAVTLYCLLPARGPVGAQPQDSSRFSLSHLPRPSRLWCPSVFCVSPSRVYVIVTVGTLHPVTAGPAWVGGAGSLRGCWPGRRPAGSLANGPLSALCRLPSALENPPPPPRSPGGLLYMCRKTALELGAAARPCRSPPLPQAGVETEDPASVP